jgi:glutamine amidotransferase
MHKIGIIDYGVGNIGSIQNMINRIGGESFVVNNHKQVEAADKLILPGVGHFDYGVSRLEEQNLFDSIVYYAKQIQRPILGICLGAQLMTRSSEEGTKLGLNLFDADVLHFSKLSTLSGIRIPHMSWSYVDFVKESNLTNNLPEKSKFYFVHSYFINSYSKEDILCTAKYGNSFVAGLQKDNLTALQFHPEKSHKFGMSLLNNFLSI